ncbi:MAG: radical SAM protein [Deltaproteobacteria bacterium]|nr:radical SAM protein [Deltaproteobacteria bacterium]
MKIDLYHLYGHFHFSSFAYPIVLDVLKVWAEEIGWEARAQICKEIKVNLFSDAAVVGISVYTQTAPAAYRLSDKLRKNGKVVILGGPHFRGPTTYKEASSHCDVVVNSICKEQWKSLLNNIAEEKIFPDGQKTLYIADKEKRFRYPNNFYETLKSQKWYQVLSIPTSIGCPFDCNFCSPFFQGEYILRDIKTIYNEVAYFKGKIVFLCDATFGLKTKFTIDLMKALAPLEKKIGVETALARLRDQKILDAMALGGVKWIIVGIETPSLKQKKHGKVNLKEDLKQVVDHIHERGMFIQGNWICGLDCDGQESFDHIYQLCKNSNLDSIMIDILTPYPNTKLYDQLLRQDRIFDTNWEHYDYHHVVYRPLRLTIDELIDGYLQLYRSVSNLVFSFKDALQVYKDNGIKTESTVVVANKLYFKLDAKRKERELRQNQKQIRIL